MHPNHGKLTSAAALIRILRYSWKQRYFQVFFVVHFTGHGDERSSQSEVARWSHEYSSAHRRKCVEFNKFKTLYTERVVPVLRREEALHHKASGEDGTAAKDLDLDLQRLREAGLKLRGGISDLESRRAWNEGEGLTKAIADDLETAVRKVEKLMHDGNFMDSQIKPWPNGTPHSTQLEPSFPFGPSWIPFGQNVRPTRVKFSTVWPPRPTLAMLFFYFLGDCAVVVR